MYRLTHVCLHTNIFICIKQISMSAFIHICIHAYLHHMDSQMCVHAQIDTCVHTHTYIQTDIPMYVCAYIHGESCMPNTDIQTDTPVCL